MFKLVWLRGALSQTSLNVCVCVVVSCCLFSPICFVDMVPSCGVQNSLHIFVVLYVYTYIYIYCLSYGSFAFDLVQSFGVLARPPLARLVLFEFAFY